MSPLLAEIAALGPLFGDLGSSLLFERGVEFFTFRYQFAVNALLTCIIVGSICGAVGSFLVSQGTALIGDATGHATLPGVCLAFLIVGSKATIPLLLGALAAGFAASLLVGLLATAPRSRPDAAIGIVLSVFFGIGIVLLSYIQNDPSAAQSGLQGYLFGNAAAVSRESLVIIGAVSAALALAIFIFYRPLSLVSFDPGYAEASGQPVRLVRFGLLAALSLAVVLSIQAVGVVLVSAMLIIPPSTALFLSGRFRTVIVLSAVLGATAGALGAFASYLLEGFSTGPTMVVVAGVFFGLAALLGPRGGVVVGAFKRWRRRLRTRDAQEAPC